MRFLKLFFLFLFITPSLFAQQGFEAKKGILDLRKWDFKKQPVITLDGEWEFYWNKLYTSEELNKVKKKKYLNVHQSWNSIYRQKTHPSLGFATYKLTVLLSKNFDENLAFKMFTVGTAYSLYIDNDLLYTVGKVSKNKESAKSKYFPTLITLNQCPYEKFDIIFHVSNYQHRKAGLWEPIRFGIEESIINERESAFIFSLFLFGGIFIMCLYHLGLFILLPNDKSTLYFGLSCFFVTFRVLVTNEYILSKAIWIPWFWLLRIEYITLFAPTLTFSLFIHTIFPKDFSKTIIKLLCYIVPFFIITSIVLPSYYTSFLIIPFQYLVVTLALYGFLVVFRATLKRRFSSEIFLVGVSVLIITIINDILYTEDIINTGSWGGYGFLVFIFSQAFLLSQRFSIAFKNNEKLNLNLDKSKKLLEEKVVERTADLIDANQKLVEQKNELEELNRELEGLVNIVAHDLKAPLNKVKGLGKIIKLTSELNNEQQKCIRLIDDACIEGESLIQDLLDISAFGKDESQLNLEKVNLKLFLAEFIDSYYQLAENKNIKMHLEIDNVEEFTFNTEESYLRRILDNLLSNAIKFSYQDSNIWLKAKKNQSEVIISVKDEGQGLTKEDQEKIFQKFQKLSARPTGGESSNGLGLSIVKALVDKLEGKIEVRSKKNKGTEFIVILVSK